jgi:hypothetical protein
MANPRLVRVFYSVDAAVGQGCPNRLDDVFLVQFLMNAIWDKKDLDPKIGLVGAEVPRPRVDGICGPETVKAIRRFQEFYLGEGSWIDGRVDPLPGDQVFGPIHKQPYTIIGLNVNVGVLLSIDRHAMLVKEPGFPPLLKQKFYYE